MKTRCIALLLALIASQAALLAEPLVPPLACWSTGEPATDVVLRGSFAYVTAGASGLQILDLSSPREPRLRGEISLETGATSIELFADRAYIGTIGNRVEVIDVSDPDDPQLVGGMPQETFDSLAISQIPHRAYRLTPMELHVLDLSNPAAPRQLGSLTMGVPFLGYAMKALAAAGEYAVVADDVSFHLVDVSDPANPQVVTSEPEDGWRHFAVIEGHLITSDGEGFGIYDFRSGKGFDLVVVVDSEWRLDGGFSLRGDRALAGGHLLDVSDLPNILVLGKTRGNDLLRAVEGNLGVGIDGAGRLLIYEASAWDPFPRVVGRLSGAGSGGFPIRRALYGVVKDGLLRVIDLADPRHPRVVSELRLPLEEVHALVAVDDIVYVSDRYGEVVAVDLREEEPLISEVLETSISFAEVHADGPQVWLHAPNPGGSERVQAQSLHLTETGALALGPEESLDLRLVPLPFAENIVLQRGEPAWRVLELGGEGQPRPLAELPGLESTSEVLFDGTLLYAFGKRDFLIFDLADPASPRLLANLEGAADDLVSPVLLDKIIYAAHDDGERSVEAFDVSDPLRPLRRRTDSPNTDRLLEGPDGLLIGLGRDHLYLASGAAPGNRLFFAADRDADGLSDSLERFFGSDPASKTANPLTIASNEGDVLLTFPRAGDSFDLEAHVQWSRDGANWFWADCHPGGVRIVPHEHVEGREGFRFSFPEAPWDLTLFRLVVAPLEKFR